MSYSKTSWINNQLPAINAENLNKIEQGIADAHELAANGGNVRPGNPKPYQSFFDDLLGKPIWWTGSKWVDAVGVEVT